KPTTVIDRLNGLLTKKRLIPDSQTGPLEDEDLIKHWAVCQFKFQEVRQKTE
ncbi:unnamed protein product, partial [Cercopithifilaria johnstoni]